MNSLSFEIRPMSIEDIDTVANIHQLVFIRQKSSKEWITCNFNAQPKTMLYVACVGDRVAGYIIWTHKAGFRAEVVLELEQLAVHPDWQRQGIARQLIGRSLDDVREVLNQRNVRLKHILVTTRIDNEAQNLYRHTLGAEVEATLANLYSADEAIMVARNVIVPALPEYDPAD